MSPSHSGHGHTRGYKRSPTYSSWSAMLQRCLNPNNNRFYAYGAKGVKICDRWLSFEDFLADLGPRPKGYTLGRKDDTGNYEPGNAWWQSSTEQSRLGSRNPVAKLSEDKVIAARSLLDSGAMRGCSLKNMAADLGVSMPALSEAINGRTWKHV